MSRPKLFLAFVCAFGCAFCSSAFADLVTWDASTDSTWTGTTDSTSWSGATYNDGDDVQFLGAGGGTVTISGVVTPSTIVINSASDYTFVGDAIAGTGGITKSGTGTIVLNSANTFSGQTVINGGVIQLGSSSALGSTAGNTVINNGGALDLGGTNLNSANVAENFVIGGTGTDGAGGRGAIFSTSGGAQLDAGSTITMAADAEIGGGGSRIDSWAAFDGGGFNLTKVGSENWWNWSGSASNIGTLTVDDGAFLGVGSHALANAATSVHVKENATFMTWGTGQSFSSDWTFEEGSQFANNWNGANASTHAITGNITLNGTTTFASNANAGVNRVTTLSGDISGAGGIRKTGNHTLILSGNNTYSGVTDIDAGRVQAGSTSAFGTNSAVSVAADAFLGLDGNDNTIGSLAGAGTVENANATAALLTTGGDNSNTTFSGVIQDGTGGGALALTKTGTGRMILSGANTYTGETTINGGVLEIQNSSALGSAVAGTTVGASYNDGSKLELNGSGGDLTVSENLTFAGGVNGILRNLSGNNQVTGQITLNGSSDFRENSGSLTLSGGIVSSNDSGLSLNGTYVIDTNSVSVGTGTLTFTSNDNNPANATEVNVSGNTWGVTRINFGGYVKVGVDNALPTTSNVEFGWSLPTQSSATLDLNGFDQTVASLSQSSNSVDVGGDIKITGNAGDVLTIDLASGTKEYQGRFEGGVSIVKTGAGTQILDNKSGTLSSQTGTIDVNEGTLLINSNESGASGDVTVASGATLGGTGTVGGMTSVQSGGNLAPGEAGIGTLTIDDDLDLDGNLLIELDGASGGFADLLAVNGTLDITGATLDFSNIGSALDDNIYVFATHNGLIGEFASISNQPVGYSVIYNFNGGNNIVLTSIPEPGTLTMSLSALLALSLRRRRRTSKCS